MTPLYAIVWGIQIRYRPKRDFLLLQTFLLLSDLYAVTIPMAQMIGRKQEMPCYIGIGSVAGIEINTLQNKLPELREEDLIALINWLIRELQLVRTLIKLLKQAKQVAYIYKPIFVKKKQKRKQKTCSFPSMKKSPQDSLVDTVAVWSTVNFAVKKRRVLCLKHPYNMKTSMMLPKLKHSSQCVGFCSSSSSFGLS